MWPFTLCRKSPEASMLTSNARDPFPLPLSPPFPPPFAQSHEEVHRTLIRRVILALCVCLRSLQLLSGDHAWAHDLVGVELNTEVVADLTEMCHYFNKVLATMPEGPYKELMTKATATKLKVLESGKSQAVRTGLGFMVYGLMEDD
jgi:hypothetical protein